MSLSAGMDRQTDKRGIRRADRPTQCLLSGPKHQLAVRRDQELLRELPWPFCLMTCGFSDIGNGDTRFEIRVAVRKAEDMAFLEDSGAEFEKTIFAEIEALQGLLENEIEATAGMPQAQPRQARSGSSKFLNTNARSIAR